MTKFTIPCQQLDQRAVVRCAGTEGVLLAEPVFDQLMDDARRLSVWDIGGFGQILMATDARGNTVRIYDLIHSRVHEDWPATTRTAI